MELILIIAVSQGVVFGALCAYIRPSGISLKRGSGPACSSVYSRYRDPGDPSVARTSCAVLEIDKDHGRHHGNDWRGRTLDDWSC
jgi:hypothetical protein